VSKVSVLGETVKMAFSLKRDSEQEGSRKGRNELSRNKHQERKQTKRREPRIAYQIKGRRFRIAKNRAGRRVYGGKQEAELGRTKKPKQAKKAAALARPYRGKPTARTDRRQRVHRKKKQERRRNLGGRGG